MADNDAPTQSDAAQETIESLTAQVAELTAQLAGRDQADQIEALAAQVTELQTKLDAAVAEACAAVADRDAQTAYLEGVAAEAAAAAAAAERRDARIEAVKALNVFTGEKGEAHIAASADRWAAMDDDTFESTIADYREAAQHATAAATATADPAGAPADPTDTSLGAPTVASHDDDISAARRRVLADRHNPLIKTA